MLKKKTQPPMKADKRRCKANNLSAFICVDLRLSAAYVPFSGAC
jgi:hypothetical protein